jgi:alkylation response protein AidB-like acyl-CoA dehydrogenase
MRPKPLGPARRCRPGPDAVAAMAAVAAAPVAAREVTRNAAPDTGRNAALELDRETRHRVAGFLETRAAAVDCGQVGVREGIAFLQQELAGCATEEDGPNGDLVRVAETISTAASADMSTAFSLWCQRMVLEYLSQAPAGSTLREEVLPAVAGTRLFGSTALAAAMAHHVGGAPLTVTWRRDGGEIVLDGRVAWASNLSAEGFVMVTAAAHVEDGREILVAIPGDAPGFEVAPYPQLMALQATCSSSATLRGVRLGPERVVSEAFTAFITRVRPPFLVLQSSFAWGLARRALAEAEALLRDTRGPNEVLLPDLDALQETAARLAGALRGVAATRGRDLPIREVVRLRLEAAQLATAAVALEAKAAGGRGYVVGCGTARRLREAAFLPIQAPTEGQLRWELSRSA